MTTGEQRFIDEVASIRSNIEELGRHTRDYQSEGLGWSDQAEGCIMAAAAVLRDLEHYVQANMNLKNGADSRDLG
jgi:hypothetical protein